jgi:hypothetical protein
LWLNECRERGDENARKHIFDNISQWFDTICLIPEERYLIGVYRMGCIRGEIYALVGLYCRIGNPTIGSARGYYYPRAEPMVGLPGVRGPQGPPQVAGGVGAAGPPPN